MSATIEAPVDPLIDAPRPPGSDGSVPRQGDVALLRPALVGAGAASLAAGAIHAVAIGAHAGHAQAQWAFLVVALFQLGWGAVALNRSSRGVALVGAAGNFVVLAGWVLTKTTGIGWIEGLESAEPVQTADAIAAVLAVLSIGAAAVAVFAGRRVVSDGTAAAVRVVAIVAAVALGAWGMASTGGVIGGGHEHVATEGAADGHAAMDHGGTGHGAPAAPGAPAGHGEHATAVPPVPYDPTLPIDLGGIEGVTPQQQAKAENLIAITLDRLPRFADPAAAVAAGYQTIGDAGTGHEHFMNYSYVDDEHFLNPDFPESLVYEVKSGKKTLVAAMFMTGRGVTLESVPDIGGKLMQWHVHDNLCFTKDPVAPKVRGVTNGPNGACPPGLNKGEQTPMIHVWITPHRCGPFAALDGVGGGTIPDGEKRLCDAAHGGH